MVLLALAASRGLAEAPPLPSSRFGEVLVAGAPAPAGTEVSAWLGASRIATTSVQSLGAASVYRLDVPGDRQETAEREGPSEGESFEIRVGGAVGASETWTAGALAQLDLAAIAGADLAVEIDDAVATVSPGAEVDLLVSVENLGPGEARGTLLEVDLPQGASAVAASDGGQVTGSLVTWPPFTLAAGGLATRSLRLRLDASFPSGIDSIAVTARVAHDGTGGADPDPSNGRATDTNLLDASPDLAVALSDGHESVAPGATLVYRARLGNHGTQGAVGVTASLSLPDGVNFFSASHGGSVASGSVSWPAFALPAGAQTERSVTVRVPENLASDVVDLTATATLSDDGTNGSDADPSDNDASDTDLVSHAPDLEVSWVEDGTMATDPQALSVSGTVAVAIENRGTLPAPASDVVVFSDENDNGLLDDGIDTPLGTATHGVLAPGASEALSVAVTGIVRFLGDRVFAMVDASRAILELDESNNVADDSGSCGVGPSPSPFDPIVERHWPPPGASLYRPAAIDSLSTPLAVQLTDDNGDGLWNALDVPDLVFVTTDLTYLLEPQVVLRAVRGDTLAPIFDVDGFFPHPTAPTLLSFSGLAAGDIDRDGKPEILSTTFGPAAVNYLRAYEHTGALKWVSQPFHTNPSPTGLSNRDNPTIADLDGDGEAEIVVGANVFDRFGRLLWTGSGGQAFQSSGNSGDRGGAISVVTDLDLDGRSEVVAGSTVYRHDGTIYWASPLPDGYPAIGDFDADPRPEVVVVAAGAVRLHDDDGTLLWGPLALPGSDPEAGGAPTVGDFDGDGEPEIGVAGSDVYVVFDADGAILWQASTQDYSSNLTGSTSFDFDGDGALEIVYRDERRLRIYRGSDGAVLFEMPISSNTWTEEPIVVDVDRDGNAEIVVTSDRAPDVALPAGERTSGLFVIGDGGDGWIAARGLWNQHAYVPEQIEENAGIPASPAWGWLDHNRFRANVPPGGEPSGAPDLTASRILLDLSALPQVSLAVRIGNGGRLPVGPGLTVALYDGDPSAGGVPVEILTLDDRLDPGSYLDLTATLSLAAIPTGLLTVVADDDGSGAGRERECDETNNSAGIPVETGALGLWLTLDDGTTSVGAGDEVTYTIEVHNAFAAEATGVVVTDTPPPHTVFVAASAGGTEVAGEIVWPDFVLPPGAAATRTLTLRVDPSIPLAVGSITNLATVVDDGSHGPDPTPENNSAADVDAVTSVTADAGGPYAGPEGSPLALDGSGSFDRDGTIVAYEWELDGDGAFDDATGVLVDWLPPSEGDWPIALRVTDDSGESDVDATVATLGNEPPIVVAPAEILGVEGGEISLAAVECSDASDPLSATVDWGDGAIETVAIVAGSPQAAHAYDDDGDFTIGLCVSDGSADETCVEILARVDNAPPEVLAEVSFGFEGWIGEELGGGATAAWSVSTGGRTATEQRNGEPTLFVGDRDAYGTHELSLRVGDPSDDDFVGLAFGFAPGDLANPAAHYYLLDWRRGHQSGAVPGLALAEVFGVPSTYELWLHEDQANNGPGNGVREVARAVTLGDVGWSRHTDYRFRVEHSPSRLRVWVDGTLELDVAAAFGPGRFALYDYSQAQAIFTALATQVTLVGFEGEPAPLAVPFVDPGRADTHVARIDWGDGLTESTVPVEESGAGEVLGAHVYSDDGAPPLEVCVDDDDGATACSAYPARVWNRPPVLSLSLATSGFLDDAVTLDGTTFTDAGPLDTHVATIDWGDGTVEPAAVAQGPGSGSIGGSHLYANPGSYAVRLCVEDDDGGSDCAETSTTLLERVLDLAVTTRGDVTGVRPGTVTGFDLVVANLGSLPATGIVLTASLPAHTTALSASDGGVIGSESVTWSLGALPPGATVARRFEVSIAADAPVGAVLASVARVVDDGASGGDADPSNNESVAELRVSDGVTPIVELPPLLAGTEGLVLALADASWNDTGSSEPHSGTVDWGDGSSGPVTLTPSRGLSGAIDASHVYVEDGDYVVTVCVRDNHGHVGCASTAAAIVNATPDLLEPGAVLLHYWLAEQYDGVGGPLANWVIAADGLSVRQTVNSRPSIFLSPLPAYDTSLEGSIRVGPRGNWDDDFIGFVLGFQPGDTLDPAADYLLIDWKQANQDIARRGLALLRVTGLPIGNEFWAHTGNITELARGRTLGARGWQDNREYHFRFEYSPSRLRVWVDGILEFDLEGGLPDGNFGFYNYSQEDVYYRGFASGLDVRHEGDLFELRVPYVDPGLLDTHEGSIAWDDGVSSTAVAATDGGFGFLTASHVYEDDGDFSIHACVHDDELAEDCGTLPLVVLNQPPSVSAQAAPPAVVGEPWTGRIATFSDPGSLDSHVARIDWGDGDSSAGAVLEDAGVGSVDGGHRWSSAGTFPVEVCVSDDDGGEGCDALEIQVLASPPALSATKTYALLDRDGDGLAGPGDDLLYRIVIANQGAGAANDVVLSDPIPAHTRVVPGSATPSLLVRDEDPLVVEIPSLASGSSIVVQFAVTIDATLPVGVSEIVNSGLVASAELPTLATDDPSLPGTADPTRTPLFATSGLAASKRATLVDLDGDGVATPGDEIAWTLTVVASGQRAAAGVTLVDPIPTHTSLVAGSVETSRGEILALDPLVLSLTSLEPGESVTVSFRTAIDLELPPQVETIDNQARLASDEVDGVLSDDPATPEPLDPTRVPVFVHPTLTASGAAILEGAEGTSTLAFLLELDHPARLPASVDWVAVGDNATAGEDFVAATGTAILAPGALQTVVGVAVLGDAVVEPDETLHLELSSPAFVRLANDVVSGTILNDDATAFELADTAAAEGETLVFPITLAAPSALPVSVAWRTVDDSAQAGIDYLPANGTLVLSPYQTAATVAVTTLGDEEHEPDEVFRLLFSDASGAGLPDPEALGTILDDDPDCSLVCGGPLSVVNDAGVCDARVELPDPQSVGNCGPVVCEPPSGSLFPVGTTEVTCSATTATATCTLIVTVTDVEPPTVAVNEISVANDPGLCSAVVVPTAEVLDNCPIATVAACDPAGDLPFPVGSTSVLCVASDAAGNSGSGSGSVHVLDLEPPVLDACPDDRDVVAPPGALSWPVEYPAPDATDNCPELSVACDPSSGASFPVGTTSVLCVASDAAGLADHCDFDVRVDTRPPVEIPTLSPRGLALFAAVLALVALAWRRRSRRADARSRAADPARTDGGHSPRAAGT